MCTYISCIHIFIPMHTKLHIQTITYIAYRYIHIHTVPIPMAMKCTGHCKGGGYLM